MSTLNSKQGARLSLASFKATAGVTTITEQVRMITGGALAGCHPVKVAA
jgi:hypothetical protein